MGRSVLTFVIGLGVVFTITLGTINNSNLASVDSSTMYYCRTMAHAIATAAANAGITKQITGGYSDISGRECFGGKYDLAANVPGDSSSITITAVGRYPVPASYQYPSGEVVDTVIALLEKTPLQQFGYFSDSSSNIAGTWSYYQGPAHTNGSWLIDNTDAQSYYAPLSARMHVILTGNGSLGGPYPPVFYGGYTEGEYIPRPGDALMNLAYAAAGQGALFVGDDVYLQFYSDGTVAVRIPAWTGTKLNQTIQLSALAPGGLAAVRGGNFDIKGQYHGKVTLAALSDSGNGGSIYIVDDGVRAANDPANMDAGFDPSKLNLSSTDFLGLVAEQDILFETAHRTVTGTNVYLEAACYAQNGGLGVEDLSSAPQLGVLRAFGALIVKAPKSLYWQDEAPPYDWHGFAGGPMMFDWRLVKDGPPQFPVSAKVHLVSWWESEGRAGD